AVYERPRFPDGTSGAVIDRPYGTSVAGLDRFRKNATDGKARPRDVKYGCEGWSNICGTCFSAISPCSKPGTPEDDRHVGVVTVWGTVAGRARGPHVIRFRNDKHVTSPFGIVASCDALRNRIASEAVGYKVVMGVSGRKLRQHQCRFSRCSR